MRAEESLLVYMILLARVCDFRVDVNLFSKVNVVPRLRGRRALLGVRERQKRKGSE